MNLFRLKFRSQLLLTLLLSVQAFSPNAFGATYFVATNGLDSNSGSSNAPFATIMRAQTAAASNDVVYLRGGTYLLANSNLVATNSPWAIVNNITNSGIGYLAFPGERPIFDFSAVEPAGYRVTAFLVSANNCTFRGFDVVGVTINVTGGNTQSECFRVTGNRNRFEQLAMHDGMGIGWYLTSGQSNLVLNCDAYNNRGLDSYSIGNIDGFGCHPNSTSGTGNVLIGCRAWCNSDDGYDCINAKAKVTFSNCWAFFNGYYSNLASSGGDGNGFKSGGYGVNASTTPPSPAPRHVTEFCLSASNRVNGFYANHHTGGLDWFNNTAYRNSANYNMLCNLDAQSSTNDVPGFDNVMKNNVGYAARSSEISNLGATNDTSFNYFTLPVTVTATDFQSLDMSLLKLPRQTNGDLPYIAFAQLASSSDAVNAGTNYGFSFTGSAPDLGAFEYGRPAAPMLGLSNIVGGITINAIGGPAGGTNYLYVTTDLLLPRNQWTLLATNVFNSSGAFTFTNTAPLPSQRFYSLALP